MEIKGRKSKKSITKEIRSWTLTIAVPVIAVLLLNLFIIKIAYVSGISMSPTLNHKDTILVWMLGYTPKQGDIVVIDLTDNKVINEVVVKRVIAVAGQTVRIDYDGNTVYVDEKPLREHYINSADSDCMLSGLFGDKELTTVTVPEGNIFVLGDNRNNSMDSRAPGVGLIKTDDIIGKSVLVIPTGKSEN